jgi:hypothetical protein
MQRGRQMPRLGLLMVIVSAANVVTALSTLFVAIQLWRWDIGNLTVDISEPVPVYTGENQRLNVNLVGSEITLRVETDR